MSLPIQEALNLALPEPFLPTAASLRVGDVLEGHSDRAFPRPRHVLGLERCSEGVRVIYRERVGGEEIYGTVVLPVDAPVSLQPPF